MTETPDKKRKIDELLMTDEERKVNDELREKQRKLAEDLATIHFAKQTKEIEHLAHLDQMRVIRTSLGLDSSYNKFFELPAIELKRTVREEQQRVANLKRIYERLYLGGRLTYDCDHGHGVGCDLCSPDSY